MSTKGCMKYGWWKGYRNDLGILGWLTVSREKVVRVPRRNLVAKLMVEGSNEGERKWLLRYLYSRVGGRRTS